VLEAAEGDASVPYQVDGDPVGDLPVEMWATEERLLVRLPAVRP
jgi:hypothetical protein